MINTTDAYNAVIGPGPHSANHLFWVLPHEPANCKALNGRSTIRCNANLQP